VVPKPKAEFFGNKEREGPGRLATIRFLVHQTMRDLYGHFQHERKKTHYTFKPLMCSFW